MDVLDPTDRIGVVIAPPVVKKYEATLDDYIRQQIREAVAYQAPSWVDPQTIEITAVAKRSVRRSDDRERRYDTTEMLITARVYEQFPMPYAMPLFAQLEHWDDPMSCGTVMRDMWAESRTGRLYIRRMHHEVEDSIVPLARWQLASQAWAELRAYAEHGDDGRSAGR